MKPPKATPSGVVSSAAAAVSALVGVQLEDTKNTSTNNDSGSVTIGNHSMQYLLPHETQRIKIS